ncbi:NAD(P)-dependent oxidoreductase [Candidatus Njordibacter sp. Uisw_056]|mgnify:FL=1|jgi:3-hydroxyisobutyrate dehydrogenase|uniref:NAD(P)-dependent oxidoreductase n=1 Tax=Candidatus Njordibacter sp. Uisw_056 TaxID=3230973 RepID=UPI003D58F62A|tara:strand:+ start:813 stop:1688 length:876 start_codon:yes stop_codon:yes gene_type:complete
MSKVAFIGLGVMGYPMAGHLAAQGHQVCVYNRTMTKSESWQGQYGGHLAISPSAAALEADFVFTCVGNDDDLCSVVYGDQGVLSGMAAGSVLIDHTTASAQVAREIAVIAAQRGVGFVDAPVSGGQAGAENGALAIMCGGNDEDYQRAQPIMQAYAKTTTHLGPVGNGQLTKMVNQICIAGLVQGLAEGVAFAINAGLDAKQALGAIGGGAAGSWQMHNRGETMVDDEFEFGFAVDWMRKDLGICITEAQSNGSQIPVAQMVDDFYEQVQARGGNRWDTSSLLRRLPRKDR